MSPDSRRSRCLALVEDLGDAEVQQPHDALMGDEDVGRLQVAVDDLPVVGVGDGLGDLHELFQSAAEVECISALAVVGGVSMSSGQ